MASVFIQNFGCRVNQAEAFAWAETLQAGGLRLAHDWRTADVIVVNTCTLTGRADRDVNRFLRRVLREYPQARLAITGCAAEQLPKDILRSSHVILALPNADKGGLAARLLSLLREARLPEPDSGNPLGGLQERSPGPRSNKGDMGVDAHSGPRSAEVAGETGHREPSWAWRSHVPGKGELEPDAEEPYPYRARAYLKVQDGCDNRCTFCVIPSVRGRCRSVPAEDVITRVCELTANGFREIVLAGIHLSSYGEDFGRTAAGPSPGGRKEESTLTDLLRKIETVPGLGCVRLSSLDPRKLDESFISYVAGNPLICQHFHLSLQHASAGILRRMGRPALRAETSLLDKAGAEMPRTAGELGGVIPPAYEALLLRLRTSSPAAAIGADIIVGFPGERDEDFATLETFLERSPLSYFHVFSYSPRRGTPAAGWPQVQESVKSARAKRLRRLSAAKNLAFRRSFLGKELDAVVISAPAMPGPLESGIIAIPAAPASSANATVRTRATADSLSDNVIATALAGGDLECGADQGTELLTGNYLRVIVPSCPASRRDLVRVRITRVLSDRSEGIVVLPA